MTAWAHVQRCGRCLNPPKPLNTHLSSCPLVPAEYNVLVHNNELYCIDVSQAVELDHPRAFDFLREGACAAAVPQRRGRRKRAAG